jgi:hypothetical protein
MRSYGVHDTVDIFDTRRTEEDVASGLHIAAQPFMYNPGTKAGATR